MPAGRPIPYRCPATRRGNLHRCLLAYRLSFERPDDAVLGLFLHEPSIYLDIDRDKAQALGLNINASTTSSPPCRRRWVVTSSTISIFGSYLAGQPAGPGKRSP